MTDWQRRAACADHDPDLWFPTGHTPRYRDEIRQAKAICAACPVADACALWAAEAGVEFGIWGGHDEKERRRAHRGQTSHGGARATAPCGTRAAYQRHVRHGEDPCAACQDANAAEKTARRAGTRPAVRGTGTWAGRLLSPCGTRAAYRRHKRRGEEPCRACREAERLARYERSAQAKKAAA